MLLTVVLVIHHHQAWIRPALASVLGQTFRDVEVVVVDDASTDHGPRILAEVAGRDPRVRVHRSGAPRGLAASRESALGVAEGEYVWFVEASDLLPAGAVVAVAAGVMSSPDVLLVGETEQDLYGVQRRPPGPVGRRPVLRDRVVRRDHLIDQLIDPDLPSGGGRFAEVPLATAVLARARTVERLDTALYVHRLLPGRVVEQWAEGDPFDVFAAYDRAFAELSSSGAPAISRAALVSAMLAQQRASLAGLPQARRPEFFHEMSRALRKHRSDAPRPADRVAWLERAALEADSYQVFEALQRPRPPVVRTARRLLRTVPRNRAMLRSRAGEVFYLAERRKPLVPRLAVFAAYWGSAYSCNPRAIYEKARETAPWIRGVWVVKPGSEHVLPPGVEHVVEGSREYYRVMARATYFVNNVNFANEVVKRPGQVHLQTHHGTPLKTMGLDLVNAPHSSLGLNLRRLMKRVQRWDYSISANEFSTEIWERVYPSGTYESLETGYPRNDVLATATPVHRARVRAELGVEPGQKAVLYTPTHREYTKEYVPLLDVGMLAEALGPEFVVMMRAHYFYRGATLPEVSSRVVDVAAHPSIEDLAIASDLLVTDYSSLMFDYAVLDRPIVIYAPDWEIYRAERGTYFDLIAEPPGAVATTQAELTDILCSGRAENTRSAALRRVFRDRYCSLEDGRAAERVVRRLWPDSSAPAPGARRGRAAHPDHDDKAAAKEKP